MKLKLGQAIGNYRVTRFLGEGGAGAVYEVEHAQLGVHYALKTFANASGHVEALRQKFLTEGKLLARLRHKNLIRVYDMDVDESTGMPYFVMDIVLALNGFPCTLADFRTDDLDEERVVRWFCELADTLDYIHAQGIVHRDIKLSNILIAEDGRAVLSDFGVSRLFSDRLRGAVSAVNTMVTGVSEATRLVMGTQGYMAPEIIRGEEATPAADAYSLGVMFIYLLTGIWYEQGSKVFRLLETLEYPWVEVLRPLVAESPAERPQTLAPLAMALRRPRPTTTPDAGLAVKPVKIHFDRVSATPAKKRLPPVSQRAIAVSAVLAILIAAIGACAYFWLGHPAHARSAKATVDAFDEAFSASGIFEGAKR